VEATGVGKFVLSSRKLHRMVESGGMILGMEAGGKADVKGDGVALNEVFDCGNDSGDFSVLKRG
jgi:tRNA-binding EMAP/Myf-like protein